MRVRAPNGLSNSFKGIVHDALATALLSNGLTFEIGMSTPNWIAKPYGRLNPSPGVSKIGLSLKARFSISRDWYVEYSKEGLKICEGRTIAHFIMIASLSSKVCGSPSPVITYPRLKWNLKGVTSKRVRSNDKRRLFSNAVVPKPYSSSPVGMRYELDIPHRENARSLFEYFIPT